MMRLRKSKMEREKNFKEYQERLAKRVHGKRRINLEEQLEDVYDELKDLYHDRNQLMIDMEQEIGLEYSAESPDSDKIDNLAQDYGSRLNDIDEGIEKLLEKRNRLELVLSY